MAVFIHGRTLSEGGDYGKSLGTFTMSQSLPNLMRKPEVSSVCFNFYCVLLNLYEGGKLINQSFVNSTFADGSSIS